MFPERFSDLPAYAFPRLRALLDPCMPGDEPIAMSIGEPTHAFPDWVGEVFSAHLAGFRKYPANNGTDALLEAISGYLSRRYGVTVPASRVMALNGTREGLYNAAMALCPETIEGQQPLILMPNPFYQAYAVAALSVGAKPLYIPATEETGFLPDYASLPDATLARTAIVYVCSPSNPQGAVASRPYLRELLALAERYDFQVFADECYGEIYRDVPPPGLLEVAAEMGADPERAVVFHSLSKRSNLPGLRSGFVAGGSESIRRIRQLRAFAGAPLPEPVQAVSARAWADDTHVEANRALYRKKYEVADEVLGDLAQYRAPQAGFFLWLPVEDGEAAALKLWREVGVRVLPGAYLSRSYEGQNPGAGYIRAAMVAPVNEVERGLTRLRTCIYD